LARCHGHKATRAPQSRGSARAAGFTLLEVVLAISIAAGILVVVLMFYHQTESLRSRLLDETSRLATMRLVMERFNSELASARLSGPYAQGLSGGSDNLQFVKLGFPGPWDRTNAPPSQATISPLRLVTYSLVLNTNNDADSGLLRSEVALSPTATTNSTLLLTNDPSLGLPSGPTSRPNGTVATQIQFLRFRYWDGSAWQEAWPGPALPVGVEVSLGGDPLPPELSPDEYPFELYRRVIYLPNHAATTNSTPGLGTPALSQATQ
jgi:type II secretory pathway pseudopilin PulG